MPVKHRIIGGAGSGKYLGWATQKVSRLEKESARARAPSRTKRFTLDAGMVDVKVSIQGEQQYIKIKRKGCPPFLSGFCDAVLQNTGGPGTPFSTPIYQIEDPPNESYAAFRRFYPSPATPDEDRGWRDERGLARDEEAARLMQVARSSMYSGEMRKVVQVLQGMNVGIPYSPSWVLTHGVFLAGNGARWIIEISNNGMFAWPMQICANAIHNEATEALLPYTPLPSGRPPDDAAVAAAIEAGMFIELLDAPEMQEFYGKLGGLFPHCGWAFNSDGHKAANLCYHGESGFGFISTFIYEITITETDDRPSSASLTEVASGIYHGDRVYAQVKYPNLNGSLDSFDPLYGVHTGVLSNAPIYTFYDGNQRIDAFYENDPFASSNEAFDDELSPACFGQSDLGVERKSGDVVHTATAHFTITGIPPGGAETTGGTVSYQKLTAELRGAKYIFSGAAFAGNIIPVYAMTTDAGIKAVASYFHYAFIVPYGEREAFYLARRHVRTNTYLARSLSLSPVTYEPFSLPVTICACEFGGQDLISGVGGQSVPMQFCNGEPKIEPLGISASDHISPSCYIPGYGSTQVLYQPPNASPGACGERGGSLSNCSPIPGVYQCVCGSGGGICPNVSFPAGAMETHAEFGVEFHGSEGARKVLHPAVQDDWFFFLEPGQVQHVVAHRDAFVPTKMIISPEIDTYLGADLYSTANEYPVSEAGRYHNFIGVP